MKLRKMKLPKIINNKYVLYVVLVLAIVNVLGFLSLRDFDSIILFILTGLLSTFFSKNMIINLSVAMFVANCMFCKKYLLNHFREGFKEGADKDSDKKDNASALAELQKGISKATIAAGKNLKPEGDDSNLKWKKDGDCGEGKICSNGLCKPKSGFSQRNVPSSTPAKANHDADDDASPGDRVDYAATLEGAYDNLQKMLGDGGMKGLSEETKRLVDQQKNLMESLNNMAPVLNSAKATLDNLDMPDVGDLKNIMSKLSGGGASGLLKNMKKK